MKSGTNKLITKTSFYVAFGFVLAGVPLNQIDATENHPEVSDSTIVDIRKTSADTVLDIDGNVYTAIGIGAQVWLGENLRVTRCRNGHELSYISNDTTWSEWPGGAYCWCNDDLSNKEAYGALYNFAAVTDSCGLCPKGWRVPAESDWLGLIAFLGGESVAGGELKEVGTAHWNNPNVGATDKSGFRGLPGGGRGQISGCGEIGEYATWWSSTPYDSTYAWHYGLYRTSAKMRYNPGHRASGFSVRCIKN